MHKLIFSIALLTIFLNTFSRDYVVTKLGVGSDSTKLSTKAIQKVIDKAAKGSGGTIVLPKGVSVNGAPLVVESIK